MTPALKARIASAVFLAPLIILGILYLPSAGFAAMMLVVTSLAAREWGALTFAAEPKSTWIYTLTIAAIMALAWTLGGTDSRHIHAALMTGILFWILGFVWLTQPGLGKRRSKRSISGRSFAGMLLLVPGFCALVWVQRANPGLLLSFFLIVWAADIGAYFVGKQFGRRKLAVKISPGKTWAGAIGGLLAGGLSGAALAWHFAYHGALFAGFVLLSVIVVLWSVIGDLLVSLNKRHANIKDSGHLIPGHGGVLDRLDSIFGSVVFYAAGWLWWGLYLLNAPG